MSVKWPCCVSGIRQNNAKPLISNGLRFLITCLLTAALWVLFHCSGETSARKSDGWSHLARTAKYPQTPGFQ